MTEVAAQLYTVRRLAESDLAGTLARVAAAGFARVELYGFVDRAAEFRDALADAGLTAASAHARLVEAGDVEPVFAAAEQVGVPTVIDPFIGQERWQNRDDVLASARRLGEIARRAADRGIRIGYHNHDWEVRSTIGGRPALEVFADALDDRVTLEVDTYWAEVGGVPAVDLLARLGTRVQFLHLKDGPASAETRDQVPLGQGTLDVPDIIAAAPHALRVIELDDSRMDMMEALRQSLDFLRARGLA